MDTEIVSHLPITIPASWLHVLLGVCLGALIGLVYFRALQIGVELLITERRWKGALALQVLRLLAIAVVLYWCARAGMSLVGLLAGILLARSVLLAKESVR